jgi:hypothetical protein
LSKNRDCIAGSISNLVFTATVAASSFGTKAADPTMLIKNIDLGRMNQSRCYKATRATPTSVIVYLEPASQTGEANELPDEDEIKDIRLDLPKRSAVTPLLEKSRDSATCSTPTW